MDWLIFLLLAFAPRAFWLWFFARWERYRSEPKKLIALTSTLGLASTIPVFFEKPNSEVRFSLRNAEATPVLFRNPAACAR